MIVKTKKYQLPQKTYVGIAMRNILREQWWVALIAVALCCGYFFAPSAWWFIGTGIAVVLYLLFWIIQFTGVTQMEQGKMLFEKLSYEIDSRQVLIKLSSKQGMPIKWDNIKKVEKGKSGFILTVSKAQIIHLPYKIFNSEHEIKFLETILRRKGYVKA